MTKKTLSHISSIAGLGLFMFLAFGSMDDNDNSKMPDIQQDVEQSSPNNYQPKTNQPTDNYQETQVQEEQQDNTEQEFEKLKTSLLDNLKQCYEIAKNINQTNNEWDIDSYKAEGNKYYNNAYQDFLKIQDPKFDLTRSKTNIISRALKYYANGFNYIGNLGGLHEKEREQIQKDLENWPYKETESEKDAEEGVFKIEIESQSAMAVKLPSKGTWCLWEISNNASIWLDGNVYNNGYGRFTVTNENLPKYLHTEKNFEIRNQSLTGTTLIFKMCEFDN